MKQRYCVKSAVYLCQKRISHSSKTRPSWVRVRDFFFLYRLLQHVKTYLSLRFFSTC